MPLIPIHVNSTAEPVERAKIKQLHVKLTSTAPIEIALLNVFHRRVNSVMSMLLTSRTVRISQGRSELIVFKMTKLE